MSIWFCEMAYKCTEKWDQLALTADPIVRHCSVCQRSVHFVETPEQLEEAALEGSCIAFSRIDDKDLPEGLANQIRRTRLANSKRQTPGKDPVTVRIPAGTVPFQIEKRK